MKKNRTINGGSMNFMTSRIKRYSAGILLFSMATSAPAYAAKTPSVYKSIMTHALTSEDLYPSPYSAKSVRDLVSPKLSQGHKDASVLNLYASADRSLPQKVQFIKEEAWADLEVFANDSEANLFSKIDCTTTTFGKWILANLLINDDPLANDPEFKELHRRQRIVQALLEDEALFNSIEQALQSIKQAEPLLLVFFLDQNSARQQILAKYYSDKSTYMLLNGALSLMGVEDSEEKSQEVLNYLDKSPNVTLTTNLVTKFLFVTGALGLLFSAENNYSMMRDYAKALKGKLFPNNNNFQTNALDATVPRNAQPKQSLMPSWQTIAGLGLVSGSLAAAALEPSEEEDLDAQRNKDAKPTSHTPWKIAQVGMGVTGLGLLASRAFFKDKNENFTTDYKKIGAGAVVTFWMAHDSLKFLNTLGNTISSVTDLPRAPFNFYGDIKQMIQIQNTLQEDLMKLARALYHVKGVGEKLSQHSTLTNLLPESGPFFTMFQKKNANSQDMRELLEMLDTRTFKGKPSFFSHPGRILAANSLMSATKNEWARIFKAIGHIDAYMSIAKLMKKYKNQRVSYCFAEYVKSDTPYLYMEEFWDPQIDPKRVVTNTLELNNDMRNIYITGPNMGGKSTTIKAIGMNLLLTRLGIAAAKSIKLTPFSMLNICRYVKEDTKNDLSHFGMEAKTAQLLVQQAQSLPQGQFSFTLLDEFLKGSVSEVNTRAAKEFSQQLARIPSNICVYVTHNLELANILGQGPEKIFENYSVGFDETEQGGLKRTYKIVPGATTQHIMDLAGDEILRQVGLIPA